MDNSANPSQGGDTSIKADQLHGGSSEANTPTAFVNHGKFSLLLDFLQLRMINLLMNVSTSFS